MENISLPIILAQIANFLILYLIFKKVIAEKLYSILEERFILHEKLKQADLEKEKILEEAREKKLQILAEAKKEASQYLKNSRNIASQRVEETLNKANRDVKMILLWGEKQLEKDRNTMMADLKEHIIEMSVMLNKKIFENPNMNREFLERELAKIK